MIYLDSAMLKQQREKLSLTQKQLGEKLCVSDKTISKWETGRGLPDIGILQSLASTLGLSLTELMTGSLISNSNRSANMLKTSFYLCPLCGNIIHSVGEAEISCCGINLPRLVAEEEDETHRITVEKSDGEYFVSMEHEMTREHFISFMAIASSDCVQLVKLYPEQEAQTHFSIRGAGFVYVCCSRDGLIKKRL